MNLSLELDKLKLFHIQIVHETCLTVVLMFILIVSCIISLYVYLFI